MLIETTHTIDAPIQAVWQIFGEGFGDIADWAEVILKSSVEGDLAVGSMRTCELKDGPLTEELTQFDRDAHVLTYAVRTGLPGMVKQAQNAWTLEAVGADQTRVTSRVTIELAWWAMLMTPMVKSQFGKTIQAIMHQLDAHVVAAADKAPAVAEAAPAPA